MIVDMTTLDPNNLMTDAKAIDRYIHGGKGEVTLVSTQSHKAHTYRFYSPINKTAFPEGTIFVYVVHEDRQMYIGMLSESGFRLTARSSFGYNTEAVKGADYIVKMANNQELIDRKGMLLYHSGRCCVCGRSLSKTASLHKGIGRHCIKIYDELSSKVPWDGNS